MAAALAYQTSCIGQIAALPRSNIVVRNTFSGSCSTGWTMKSTYMTTVATTAAARPIISMESRRNVLASCGRPRSPWVSRSVFCAVRSAGVATGALSDIGRHNSPPVRWVSAPSSGRTAECSHPSSLACFLTWKRFSPVLLDRAHPILLVSKYTAGASQSHLKRELLHHKPVTICQSG